MRWLMQKQKQKLDNTEFMMITRFHRPTKFDKAPYGTVYQALVDEDQVIYYLQISAKEDVPTWKLMSEVLIKSFEGLFSSDEFMHMILSLFERAKKKDLENLLTDVH